MPKVPVLVDLPDGWELAETEVRSGKQGEYALTRLGEAAALDADSGLYKHIILRRKLSPTVRVELPREDAERKAKECHEHGTWLGGCFLANNMACRESAACREALKAEQGT